MHKGGYYGNNRYICKMGFRKKWWTQINNLKDMGRSFAIANYKRIVNDNGKINYIIID